MECLVKEFKGVSTNQMLPLYGYKQIYMEATREETFTLKHNNLNDTDAFILSGDAYFTNENGDNLGQKVNNFTHIHVAKGEFILNIKYGAGTDFNDFTTSDAYSNGVLIDFDTSILPLLVKDSQYTTNKVILYCRTIKGNIADVGNQTGTLFVVPDNDSPNFVGDLSDFHLAKWPNTFRLSKCPNITGSLNDMLDEAAPHIAAELARYSTETLTLRVELGGCPNIKYNGESIGASFNHNVVFTQAGTWTLN